MELNRRSFVKGAAAGVALVVLGSEALAQAENTKVDIGKPSDFAAGSVSDKFAKSDKILIAHNGDKIYAMTAVCTHRKGTIVLKNDKFTCPSHNSVFSIDGKPTAGPARVALARHAISVNEKGILVVDKSKSFEEANWNDAAASYAVKA
ncbi:MAG TPA: Rieske (2Fe-2S) protein [Tepidisphaeraceae bacterium]|nr:Rieske (2Fe-2S) protein [Tepidisphaeraceae bacterium]